MHADGFVYYGAVPEPGEERKLAMQMLKWGFAEFFDVEFKEEKIKRAGFGKPYYEGGEEQIQFNISHCSGAAAVAVSHRKVGIDVESMRNVNYRTAVKCCSAEELFYVLGKRADTASSVARAGSDVLSEEEARRFLQLWTLKESYVKMTGEGLRKEPNQVNFALTDADGIWKQEVRTVVGKQTGCSHFLHLPGEIVLALTVECIDASRQAEFIWKTYQPEKADN